MKSLFTLKRKTDIFSLYEKSLIEIFVKSILKNRLGVINTIVYSI